MNRAILVATVLALTVAASGSAIAAPQNSDPGGTANPYLRHPVIVGPMNPYLQEPGAGRAATNPYLRPVIVGPTNPYLKEPGAGGTNSHR